MPEFEDGAALVGFRDGSAFALAHGPLGGAKIIDRLPEFYAGGSLVGFGLLAHGPRGWCQNYRPRSYFQIRRNVSSYRMFT
jgi:hypothetical protein